MNVGPKPENVREKPRALERGRERGDGGVRGSAFGRISGCKTS
jgi:hypothetical protein